MMRIKVDIFYSQLLPSAFILHAGQLHKDEN